MSIEHMNFWNDSRTIAGMVAKPKFEETKQGVFLLWETEDFDGNEVTHRLACEWAVCGTCRGNGKHVNANIDCGGLTREDFDEDPGFEEAYMNGNYDVTCNECGGRRVTPVICKTDPMAEAYNKYRQSCWDDARESAAERAMGA